MNKYFAERVKPLKASAIREMFKLMADPEIISLAGGSPSPELFPSEELSKIAAKILMTNPNAALQYGTTDGYAPLKEIVADMVRKLGSLKETDSIIITTGGQQGIDLASKVFVNDGETVIVEAPSFVGTLNGLRAYQAKLVGVPLDDDGMNMEKLEQALESNKNVKLIYTIPTFQNPSGITMSLEKRKKLLDLARKYDVIVIEDNPYGYLRFSGEDVPTIKSLDTEGRVVYVGSFSKILSPGMRIGFTVADSKISDRIEVLKQVNDVHTPLLTQMMAVEYIKKYDMDEHIERCRKLYREKCEFMLSCMDKYFPKTVTYTRPQGGLFILCTTPEGTNTNELLLESLKYKVAFVPGNSFSTDIEKPSNLFRLNYSTMPNDKIEKGIKSLGQLLKEKLGN
ncbi:MAG: PLP-dependent aminotransferase family protein [Clostridia bacterium]|nr:PLP-dependent aminotransferase family protein [Clostridia bacterium]